MATLRGRGRAFVRRGTMVAATTAALGIATATVASAHHCYKIDWNESARAQLEAHSTAWLPLSDLGEMIISAPAEEFGYGRPDCADTADRAIAEWMSATGTTAEPLIHTRATVGSGAAYQGKAPKGFAYLSDEDFMALTVLLENDLLETCEGFELPMPV